LAKFVRDGWHVVIFGDPGHKEVRGILGWADGKVVTMKSEAELDAPLPDWMP